MTIQLRCRLLPLSKLWRHNKNKDTKRKIREICGLSNTHFQVIMTKLKKNKIIDNGKINPKFIPRVEHDSKGFQLLLAFDLQ